MTTIFFMMATNSRKGGVAIDARTYFTYTVLNTVTVERCCEFLAVKSLPLNNSVCLECKDLLLLPLQLSVRKMTFKPDVKVPK